MAPLARPPHRNAHAGANQVIGFISASERARAELGTLGCVIAAVWTVCWLIVGFLFG